GDSVPMHRLEGQRFQDEHVERALHERSRILRQRLAPLDDLGEEYALTLDCQEEKHCAPRMAGMRNRASDRRHLPAASSSSLRRSPSNADHVSSALACHLGTRSICRVDESRSKKSLRRNFRSPLKEERRVYLVWLDLTVGGAHWTT